MSKRTKRVRRKQSIRIKHPGSLSKFGFNEKESERKEKQAIRKADKAYGVKETDLKLVALETFNKHKDKIFKKMRSLIKWNEKQ
jgi:hypothetical protein